MREAILNVEVTKGEEFMVLSFRAKEYYANGWYYFERAELDSVDREDWDDPDELERLEDFFFILPNEIVNKLAEKFYDQTSDWEEMEGGIYVGNLSMDHKEFAQVLMEVVGELETKGVEKYHKTITLYLDDWDEDSLKEKTESFWKAFGLDGGEVRVRPEFLKAVVSLPAEKVNRAVEGFLRDLGWWKEQSVKRGCSPR